MFIEQQQDPFDSFPLEDLLRVSTPAAPKDFNEFWQAAYQQALALNVQPVLRKTAQVHGAWRVYEVSFPSTKQVTIRGWLLLPLAQEPKRGFVISHGYGGRTEPDFHLPFPDAALFFPCARGLGKSAVTPFSTDPYWHVLHDIDKPKEYVLKGCVEDLWLSISAMEQLLPKIKGRIGFLGISFGGGIGALALAQETRIAKAHLNVPTFGNHRLRLRLPTNGSGRALQDFFQRHPRMLLRTLRYYDAANAASSITIPMHFALALRDPVVTPAGQFAIYNQVKSEKQLFVLEAGHDEYPNKEERERALLVELYHFFQTL